MSPGFVQECLCRGTGCVPASRHYGLLQQ